MPFGMTASTVTVGRSVTLDAIAVDIVAKTLPITVIVAIPCSAVDCRLPDTLPTLVSFCLAGRTHCSDDYIALPLLLAYPLTRYMPACYYSQTPHY